MANYKQKCCERLLKYQLEFNFFIDVIFRLVNNHTNQCLHRLGFHQTANKTEIDNKNPQFGGKQYSQQKATSMNAAKYFQKALIGQMLIYKARMYVGKHMSYWSTGKKENFLGVQTLGRSPTNASSRPITQSK